MTNSEQLFKILDPTAHRRIETGPLTALLERIEAQTRPPLTAWLCDVCTTDLDDTAPIIALGTTAPSYALCPKCIPAMFRRTEPTPCPCPGCTPPR